MEKKIRVLCDLGVGGERGRVFDRNCVIGALSSTDYKDPPKAIKRLDIAESQNIIPYRTGQDRTGQDRTGQDRTGGIIVLGAIGNTDRQNRDNMRVLSGKGLIYTLKSHIDKDHPLVLKRYSNHLRH